MNKVHPVRSLAEAEKLMRLLGYSWASTATIKMNVARDPIGNQLKSTYGNAAHFIDHKDRAIASWTQDNGALTIYAKPRKVAKIFFSQLNLRKNNESGTNTRRD